MTQLEAIRILQNIKYDTIFKMEYVHKGKSINSVELLLDSVGVHNLVCEYCKFTSKSNYCIVVNNYAVTQFEGTQTWNNIFDDLLEFVKINQKLTS